LTSSIYKDLKILNTKTTNNAINKWANEQAILKKKYKWLINEEVLNNFILTESSNGNNTEILSHHSQHAYHQENNNNKMLARFQEKWKHALFLGMEISSDVNIIAVVF
jgi:hypothetical protein